jgi:prophage DNA circulation protein
MDKRMQGYRQYAVAPMPEQDPTAILRSLMGQYGNAMGGGMGAPPAMPQGTNTADNEVAAWFRANGGQQPSPQDIQAAAARFFGMQR